MKMNKLLTLSLLFLASGMLWALPVPVLELCLKENAYVSNGNVNIRDVAMIHAEDESLSMKVGDLAIGKAPNAGLIRYFTKYDILRSLRQNNIDTESLKFSGAARTLVEMDQGNGEDSPILISLKDKVILDGESALKLKDVAEIKAGTAELLETVREAVIEKIPSPGKTQILEKSEILKSLKKCRIHLQNVTFSEREGVTLYMPATLISSDEINKMARKYILEHFGWDESMTVIEMKGRMTDFSVPEGKVEYQFNISGKEDSKGSLNLELGIVQNSKILKLVKLSFGIRNFANICVAARDIAKGEMILKDDLTVERRDITLHPELKNVSMEMICGMSSIRKIDRGTPLTEKMIENPIIVKKGQMVKIEYKSEFLSLSTSGKALENGRRGEALKVKNLDTDKNVIGCVLNSETVSVR